MNEAEVAVTVQDLTKSFRIPLEASSGLKQKMINTLKGRKGYREFVPLRDVSFNIEKGDFFGIVGRNGSGKSTLLKTIAGIYTPNKGAVSVKGKLVPFIELGVGFNPELNGRENIFLNGALLGFSRKEMEGMFNEIVEFAELGDFMEERLKNYSSGMQVRLAFSIAIRAEGDILLLDEVLAVGDEAFQRKCFDYFETLRREKRTVVLVTHDMLSVERFCTKALLIDEGIIKKVGKPRDIAAAYSRLNDESFTLETKKAKNNTEISINTYDGNDRQLNKFTTGDTMTIGVTWKKEDVKQVGIAIYRQSGEYIFGTNTYIDGHFIGDKKSVKYNIDLNLSEGTYFVQAGLFNDDATKTIEFEEDGPKFIVNRDKDDSRWGGITNLKHSWHDGAPR